MNTLAEELIRSHVVEGNMAPGEEVGIRVDQTLTQDATGTLVMLELEAMGLDRVRTELSAQYVDHNLIQQDYKNADDHVFLQSACRRFGIWYSRAGNGVSHPVHQECFGQPGKTLLGSDSHTPAAGSLGMLAIGAGGLEVSMAMAGEPFCFEMPLIWGVRLSGKLPHWVSAKDVILEMLRRHGVDGGLGRIIEYYGPGVQSLSAMDRHVIANMGAELGALTSVFPSDEMTRRFLRAQGRENHWREMKASGDAHYDVTEEIDLPSLEPLIAMPSSPGNVCPVREVAGEEIYQSYIGSSANPGYRDFAIVAGIFKDRHAHENVSLDVNPASRRILENLVRDGHILSLIQAGARIHQAGCNGCIGMGQAPASGKISLRTVPRNFPGRSGTREDKVCLVSPETAAASALTGVITDPRTLDQKYPEVSDPAEPLIQRDLLQPPPEPPLDEPLAKGPNIVSLPTLDALADQFDLPVLLKVGDDISTDEIMPAGARVLPFRSNIPEISQFVYEGIDKSYTPRAREASGGHCIVGGANYGQGSSREHAALAPRYLGLRVVLAKGFARIHRQNLVNFGILPLQFASKDDYGRIETGERILIRGLREQLNDGNNNLTCTLASNEGTVETLHNLSDRQVEILLAGGLVNWLQQRLSR